MKCRKCNGLLEEGINLCPHCGYMSILCTNCGYHNLPEVTYCEKCRYPLNEITPTNAYTEKKKTLKNIKVKINNKVIYRILTSLLCIVIVISTLVPVNPKAINRILYVKDDILYDLSPLTMKSTMIDKTSYYYTIKVSKNGTRVFYAANYKGGFFELKYKDLGFSNRSGTIDTDVDSYMLNDSGTVVYYTKGYGKSLYRSNLQSTTKIEQSGSLPTTNKKGTKALYSHQNKLYLHSDNNKQLIAEGASSLGAVKDFRYIYYVKNNKLYCLINSKNEKLIAENCEYAVRYYDSGEIYFIDTNNNLCYYNKGKIKIISNNYTYALYFSTIYSSNKAILLFSNSSGEILIAKKDKVIKSDIKQGSYFNLNNSGTKVYYLQTDKSTNKQNLYTYYISKNKSKLYDKDVYKYYIQEKSGDCIYMKNADYIAGDLYVNKKKVDTSVNLRSVIADAQGNLVYSKLLNKDLVNKKSLYLYNGKNSIKITDKPYDSIYYINDKFILLTIPSKKQNCYDLYFYNGKTLKKIESDISYVKPFIKDDYFYDVQEFSFEEVFFSYLT